MVNPRYAGDKLLIAKIEKRVQKLLDIDLKENVKERIHSK